MHFIDFIKAKIKNIQAIDLFKDNKFSKASECFEEVNKMWPSHFNDLKNSVRKL